MAVIYLIRHAQTVDNLSKKFSGYTDCKISDFGFLQLEKLSDKMKNIKVDYVYSSPLERATLTGNSFSNNLITCDNLIEMNFGDFEGLTLDEIKDKNPEEVSKLLKHGFEYKFPNGESLIDFHDRVKACFYDIVSQNHDNRIAIVSHSGTIRCILSEIIGESYKYHWNFQIDNCSISKITYDEGFGVINYMNDTNHLRCLND